MVYEDSFDFTITPYRVCTSTFVKVYNSLKSELSETENGKICKFILVVTKQNEYPYKRLVEMIVHTLDSANLCLIMDKFRLAIDDIIKDINNLFEFIKQMRESQNIHNDSVAGLYLRKLAIFFDRLTHQACSTLYDDITAYVSSSGLRRRGLAIPWQTPRTTRSSGVFTEPGRCVTPIYHINHEISRLQANEAVVSNPKDLYESLRRPSNSCKKDATFLRYLNLLRVNESFGSKHLLMAYFDMVSESVPRSYSALNYAIWYLHHGEHKRAIECLQECYCCAQGADDDKCLLISLMWLARIVIQAKQKNSTKYNVKSLLELVRKRSHKAGLPYVQAMTSMALDQLNGPVDDSETLKRSTTTLKQVVSHSRQQNHFLATANQPNPLDKDDEMPSAEMLAVRNSMNDVLTMVYALKSAHFSLTNDNQSSALNSQNLLHLDLIEKCGNEDVFLINENIFIGLRNLAFYAWNSARNIQLVRDILVDLSSIKIPTHRTDHHSIWRKALAEISFEHHVEFENWSEATKMISIVRETDQDSAQLYYAELLNLMGVHHEALLQVDDLISRIEFEENNLIDPKDEADDCSDELSDMGPTSLSIEHKTFIKSKACLLRACLIHDETKILETIHYAQMNCFLHVRTACLMKLFKLWVEKPETIMESIVIEVLANGTVMEQREMVRLPQIHV